MKLLNRKASEAAVLLGSMANPKRLLVLCNLLVGERPVGVLARLVGLSPAALSQHLAKMRALELVSTRRVAQTIYYSLASVEVRQLLQTLYSIYCAPPAVRRRSGRKSARPTARRERKARPAL